ncbi:MAG: TonB family protein [Sphingobacteriales bacterium]|nr:MAG: TonB family protein [Sphingobacteriales bacterium]
MPGTKVTKSRSSAAAPVINGKVMDMVGPVPGVRVGINGTTMATVTDLNGKFTLPGNQDRVVLDVNMLGYLNKQVKVNKRDSLVIALQPKEQGLSEVTVIGYSSNRKNEEAYPVNNWAAFQKYLDENAVSADGKTGTVKLTFTVDGTGRLSDFKIADSLSEEADKIAIRLVKEGPAWLGNANGKSKNITVRIKFTTPKANNK